MIKNNLNFPVITNSGAKGGAVKKILEIKLMQFHFLLMICL